MMRRCYNPTSELYPNYGGRGIKVCARWHTLQNFCFDMGEPPLGLSLERKKNHKGYSRKNCIWADSETQLNNTRANVNIVFKGIQKSAAQWARDTGVKYNTIRERHRRGWPPDKIFTHENFRGQKFGKGGPK